MDLRTKILTTSPNHQKITDALAALKAAGATAYYVGGCVRDAILDRSIKDIDIEVHGITLESLQEILARFETVALIGKSFGVLAWFESGIDWSLPRTDSAGRKPQVTIDPQLDIADALRRRDLTMNALAVNAHTGELIDPFGGLRDIEQKVLRAPDPRFFPEDPLRFYRVLQFAARFDMEPDAELRTLCASMDLSGVAHERVADEYEKLMLQSATPSRGFTVLQSFGRLTELLPELGVLENVPQDPRWHPEGDVFEHTMQAIDSAAHDRSENIDRRILIYATLCHDLGKAVTTVVTPEKISSHGHEEAGIPLARALLRRMTTGNALIDPVLLLVRWHMSPGIFARQDAPPRAYKRLAYRLAPHTSLRMLATLSYADRRGRNPVRGKPLTTDQPEVAEFIMRAQKAGVFDAPEAPIITGKDLLAHVQPGPKIGELVKHAYIIQIEKGIRDRDELIKRVLSGPIPVQSFEQ